MSFMNWLDNRKPKGDDNTRRTDHNYQNTLVRTTKKKIRRSLEKAKTVSAYTEKKANNKDDTKWTDHKI